jgi:hypothetical protein
VDESGVRRTGAVGVPLVWRTGAASAAVGRRTGTVVGSRVSAAVRAFSTLVVAAEKGCGAPTIRRSGAGPDVVGGPADAIPAIARPVAPMARSPEDENSSGIPSPAGAEPASAIARPRRTPTAAAAAANRVLGPVARQPGTSVWRCTS